MTKTTFARGSLLTATSDENYFQIKSPRPRGWFTPWAWGFKG
jgi:hypothetical protein